MTAPAWVKVTGPPETKRFEGSVDGRLLQPLCPHVSAYLQRHLEQADLIDPTTPS